MASGTLCLSHDLDGPLDRSCFRLFAELIRRPLDFSLPEILDMVRLRLRRKHNWFFLPQLLDIERRHRVKSTLFFRMDEERYLVDDFIKAMIRSLDLEGFEVGLHASIESAFDSYALQCEKSQLEGIVKHQVAGVRHHYLALGENTWQDQSSLGFRYDSTLAGRDQVSFMQPFLHSSGLRVFPLCLMDSADSLKYRPLHEYFAFIERLLSRITEESLIFTVVFHPENFGWHARIVYDYLLSRARAFNVEMLPIGIVNARHC